ncbi:MAG: ComEC family competence protein [Bacteroidetes bacterium]|nr:MAG: ComEC family competence protein [Bacteroidota bacterium]TAG90040.1 MAG: ComEC family competence protein [Bacteroidota bacterium]
MSWWRAYPFIRFTFFFVIGIWLESVFNIFNVFPLMFLPIFVGLIVLFLGVYFVKFSRFWQIKSILVGILASCILIIFGIIKTNYYTEKHQKNHIYQQKEEIIAYQALINQEVESRKKTYKTTASITSILTKKGWKNAEGKVLLYFKKDTNTNKKNELEYGNIIIIKGSPQLLTPSLNPNQFDYSQYLAYQNIYHQQFVDKNQYQITEKTIPNYIFYYSLQFRNWCSNTLKGFVKYERESAIAVALLLGVREQMDSEILEAYSATGLMHVLAVSGMHVGLIVFILDLLFFSTWKKHKKDIVRYQYAIIMLFLLWFYAIVTGLTSSVLRAVMMFSFMIVGNAISTKLSMYNNLGVSCFVLLCFNPFLIFSAGLQLSYMAVWGIVYFQPKLAIYYQPKTYLMRNIWLIITVSITAQLATFPLGLLYFHQFPNYFLVSNLIIIPLSTGVLYIGLATLAFSWLPFVNIFLGILLYYGIWLMNFLTFLLQKLPYAVTDGIFINVFELFLVYGIIFSFALFIKFKKLLYWKYISFLVFIFVISRIFYIYQTHTQNFILLYHFNKNSSLHLAESKNHFIWADSSFEKDKKNFDFATKTNLIKVGSKNPILNDWKVKKENYQFLGKYSVLYWNEKFILILHQKLKQKEWKNLKNIEEPNIVIIRKNALFEWNQIPNHWQKTTFVFDGSNGLKRIKKLDSTKTTQKAYFTHFNGAWKIEK